MKHVAMVVVAFLVACGGGAANDLAAKQWKVYPGPTDNHDGYAFDARGRMVVGGLFDRGWYRFDFETHIWEEFPTGSLPGTTGFVLDDGNGVVYYYEINNAQIPTLPQRTLHRLDDNDVWQVAFKFPLLSEAEILADPVFDRNGVLWTIATVANGNRAVYHLTDGQLVKGMEAPEGRLTGDNAGNLFLRQIVDGRLSISLLSDAGDSATTLYSCANEAISNPRYCDGGSHRKFPNGDVLFLAKNDVLDYRTMFRVRAGSEPVVQSELPVDSNDPRKYSHVDKFLWSKAGDGIVSLNNQSGLAGHLFVLDEGDDEWTSIGRLPDIGSFYQHMTPDGTMFAAKGTRGSQLYIRE